MLRDEPRMTRGKLYLLAVRKSGRKVYNLQFGHKARHFTKAVRECQLGLFEESTDNYRRFVELVQQYIDEKTERGIREIEQETGNGSRKRGKKTGGKDD